MGKEKENQLLLKRFDRDPPGGWRYYHEGFEIRGAYWTQLVENVKRHLRVNGEAVPDDLLEAIQHQLCAMIPESFCKGVGPRRIFPTLKQIYSGTKLIINALTQSSMMVDKATAETRASICAMCPFNNRLSKCRACEPAYKIVGKIFSGQHTTYDNKLHACVVCGCMNKAQVHCTDEVLYDVTPNSMIEQYPSEYCWKRKALESQRALREENTP